MRLIFQSVIIVVAIGLIALSYPFARDVTVRNIAKPSGPYTVPYETHGGIVYISEHEQRIFYAIYGLTGACLIGQLMLRRRSRPAPSSETP